MKAGLILFIPLFAITALSLDTHAIPTSDLVKRVPMTTVFWQEPLGVVHAPDFVLTEVDDAAKMARGHDKAGKKWQVLLPAPMRGLWKSDLNGTRTYYFAGYTGGAGMAPDSWILALSFDDQRRPIPFYVTSHGAYDRNGIKDVLNLDGTGPELLQQSWIYTNFVPERSGYYITTLYQHRGPYWYRADGQHGARVFPMFERWVFFPKTLPQLVQPPPELSEDLPDYGNAPQAGVRTRILSVDAENRIHVGPEIDCDLECCDVEVEDSPTGRLISVDLFDEDPPGKWIRRMARSHERLRFTGIDRLRDSHSCSASIVWSTL